MNETSDSQLNREPATLKLLAALSAVGIEGVTRRTTDERHCTAEVVEWTQNVGVYSVMVMPYWRHPGQVCYFVNWTEDADGGKRECNRSFMACSGEVTIEGALMAIGRCQQLAGSVQCARDMKEAA